MIYNNVCENRKAIKLMMAFCIWGVTVAILWRDNF